MSNEHNPPPGPAPASTSRWTVIAITLATIAIGAGLLTFNELRGLRRQVAALGQHVESVAVESRTAAGMAQDSAAAASAALEQASEAARRAEGAAGARRQAEDEAAAARDQAEAANRDAELARQEAATIREERRRELDRLYEALSEIAETRRTALGLVMNLGSDAIEFDFDRANLRPQNRELLSRIAGILLTSPGHSIYVYGHTDDLGSDVYNLDLSERRARAVTDYLIEAGIDPKIISATGYGKSSPRVAETTSEARAKNRRVEIAIVNITLEFKGEAPPGG